MVITFLVIVIRIPQQNVESGREDKDYILSKAETIEGRQYENHVGDPNCSFPSLLKSMNSLPRARKEGISFLVAAFAFSWLYIPGLWVRLTMQRKVTLSE